jgi:hypothetical protein
MFSNIAQRMACLDHTFIDKKQKLFFVLIIILLCVLAGCCICARTQIGTDFTKSTINQAHQPTYHKHQPSASNNERIIYILRRSFMALTFPAFSLSLSHPHTHTLSLSFSVSLNYKCNKHKHFLFSLELGLGLLVVSYLVIGSW